jgi:hypothetical protein
MSFNNRVTWFLAIIAVTIFWVLPSSFNHLKQNTVWAQNNPGPSGPGASPGNIRGSGQIPRGGEQGNLGGRGGDPGGRGGSARGGAPGRGTEGGMQPGGGRGPSFTLSESEIDQLLQQVQQRDPNAATGLRNLRTTNPMLFNMELRRTPEFGKLVDRRLALQRGRVPSEFLDWLGKYVPNDANDLSNLRHSSPDLYFERYNQEYRKYGRIFDQSKTSSDPNLANILIYDLNLEETQTRLLMQIRNTPNEQERNRLTGLLRGVLSDRYDVIIKRKQLQYEQLLKKLVDLQKQINSSMDDIKRWEDPNLKDEQIKTQMKIMITPPGTGRRGAPQLGR